MGSIQYLILLVTTINIDRKTAIDIYQCMGSSKMANGDTLVGIAVSSI